MSVAGPLPAVLTYHSVQSAASVVTVSPELFAWQMEWLAGSGIPVVPLERLAATPGGVALTFDDAYRDFLDTALPVLQRHGLPASLFAVTGYCRQGGQWLDWSGLAEAARAGVTVGAHSVTHANLAALPAAAAEAELRDCRRELEDRLGSPVASCAYPYGLSTPELRAWARREFALGCGTRLDYVSPAADLADLPRLDAYYLRPKGVFRRLMRSEGRAYLALRRLVREWRGAWKYE
jgi:peptidoglycan/xylan/chitin deacetylase (PgdA/CDA1 family)